MNSSPIETDKDPEEGAGVDSALRGAGTVFALVAALLLTACSGLRAPLLAEGGGISPFFMAPYLSATSSGSLILRFWTPHERDKPEVRLKRGGKVEKLSTRGIDGVRSLPLPMTCRSEGDEGEVSYLVKGMKDRQGIVLPPCPTEPTARFVFITDTQNHRDKVAIAAKQIAAFAPEFVLHGGDLVEMGTNDQQWVDYQHVTSVYGSRVATIPTIGNHETYMMGDFPNFRRFYVGHGPTWYTFSSGPVDVVVMDSERLNQRDINEEQQTWLRTTLERLSNAPNADERWTLVMTHHAPLSTSIANLAIVPFGRSGAMRKYFVPLFEEFGVDLVLAGHTHVYERLRQNGIDYVVGGAAGGMMGILGSTHKASKVIKKARTISTFEVSKSELLMKTVDQEGTVVDELSIVRE